MVDFATFYLMWADRNGWTVPPIHWIAIAWLDSFGNLGVMMCFRGFGKSTILDVFFAYRIYKENTLRILLQSESDPSALKSSRDVQNVLRNHPLTRGILAEQGTVESWWSVEGLPADPRNPQMYSRGALSNVTGARADLIVNDDVEVPRNITTPELREKLRYRLNEQVHIAVPGAQTLFVGTPHSHDSIYDEQKALGAQQLVIPLFKNTYRIEQDNARAKRYYIGFRPAFVFKGIGKASSVLRNRIDYTYADGYINFAEPPRGLIDICGVSAWPERFNRDEILSRRKRCRTINEWDSQYQLQSKPIHEMRLDPDKANEYDVEPRYETRNKENLAYLGEVRLLGATCRWDVATGKKKADDSALSIVFTDTNGQIYWHRAIALEGELAEFNERGQIDGGQVWQVRQQVIKFRLTNVTVEVNGVGSFAGKLLLQALKGLGCGVTEDIVSTNKNGRILEGLEGPLSGGFLWLHSSVMDGPVYDQMKSFNPAISDQPDDFIDSGAGAIMAQPKRIGGNQQEANNPVRNWTGQGQVHEMNPIY